MCCAYNDAGCRHDVGISEAVDAHKASVYCAGVSRGTDGVSLVTSGGRVLTVVITDCDIGAAAHKAQLAAAAINFTGRMYRTDIALKAIQPRFVDNECI